MESKLERAWQVDVESGRDSKHERREQKREKEKENKIEDRG